MSSNATATTIQQLTLAYFGRPADPASLIGWPASGQTLNQIVQIYVGTAEYKLVTFDPNSVLNASGGRTVNETNLINTFYVRLFGRPAAAVEIAAWVNALATGAVNNDYLGITILNAGLNLPTTGAAGAMRAVLQAKIDSSNAYTTAIVATPGAAVAYSTAAAIQDGIAYNNSTTTSTAQTAAQAQAAVVTMTAGSNVNPGQAFTLTTSIETINAAAITNSTVSGTLANGIANGQTFQTGDTINGNSTTDININALANAANTVAINTARSVNFRNLSNGNLAAADTNAILWNNVGTFSSTASLAGQVGLSNGALATTYALINPLIDSAAGINLSFRATDITGATDTANFLVTGVGSSSSANAQNGVLTINNNSTGATATGVETVAIATVGTNIVDVNFGTNTTRVNVTGAGANTINMQAGGIVATSQIYNFAGATGANTLNVAGTLATSSTVTGGTGSDTLHVTPAGLAITNLSVSGIETLRLRNAAVAGTLGFTAAPAFTNIRVDAGGNANRVVTLLNGIAGTSQALTFRGADTAATTANEQVFNGITGTGALTGAADTLNIAFSNNGRALTGGTSYATGNISALGIEAFAVTITDAAAAGRTTIGDLISNTMSSVTATGTGAVTAILSGQAAGNGGNALTTINLSGLTTTAARSLTTVTNASLAAASTVTASVGGTGLVLGAEAATDVLTFNGGAGIDIINNDGLTDGATSLFTGFVNFNGGGGNDEIFFTASAGVVANGGDGNDVLRGSNLIDTLRGDAGADTITGAGGNDVLTGGTGADVFVYLAGAAATNAEFTTANGVDTITDFAVGAGNDRINWLSTLKAITEAVTGIAYQAGTVTGGNATTIANGTTVYELETVTTDGTAADLVAKLGNAATNAAFVADDRLVFINYLTGGGAQVWSYTSTGANVTAAELSLATTLTGVAANSFVADNIFA